MSDMNMHDDGYEEFHWDSILAEVEAGLVDADQDFGLRSDEIADAIYTEEEQMEERTPHNTVWYEQETWYPDHSVMEGFYGGTSYYKIFTPDHYGAPVIEAEKADKVVTRRYKLDEDADPDAIEADLDELMPTISWRDSDNNGVAVTFYDLVDGEFVPRDWDDLRKFAINMSNIDKLFKRMSTINVRSYTYGEFDVIMIPAGETDEGIERDRSKTVTVQVLPTPKSEFRKKSVDGSAYARKSLRNVLITQAFERISGGEFPDLAKAQRIAKKLHKTWTFDTFRGLFGMGLMKAMGLIADDENLAADIVIYDCNVKTEVFRPDNRITLTMNAKEQAKKVRTNPQVLSLFGEWLHGKDLSLVKWAYNKQVERIVERFVKGTFVPDTKDKGGYTLNEMATRWIAARGTINESQYLMKMMRDAHIKSQEQKEDETKRKMPAPFTRAYSIRSQAEMVHLLGHRVNMGRNEIRLTKWGVVIGDGILLDVLEILGGADFDDVAELWVFVAGTDSELFHVRKGQTVGVMVRNPVGVSSNGKEVGIEYWVAPFANPLHVQRAYRADGFPIIDLRKGVRPNTITELNITTPESLTIPQKAPQATYDMDYVWSAWEDAIESSPGMVYGRHVNLMMQFAKYGIPFKFTAKEETYVDGCTTDPHPDFIREVNEDNKRKTRHLVAEVNRRGIAMDPHDIRRLGLKGVRLVAPGLMSNFVDHHKLGVEFFTEAANAHIEQMFELYREVVDPESLVPEGITRRGEPYRMMPAVLSQIVQKERKVGYYKPQHIRDAIGRSVYNELVIEYGDLLPGLAHNALLIALYNDVEEYVDKEYAKQGMTERGLYYGVMSEVLLAGFQERKPLNTDED